MCRLVKKKTFFYFFIAVEIMLLIDLDEKR